MPEEYISREAALKDFEASNAHNPYWTPPRVKTLLLRQPAADVAEVVQGQGLQVRFLRQQAEWSYGLPANKRWLLAEGSGFLQLRRVSDKYRGERQCFRLSFYPAACSWYTQYIRRIARF